MVPACYLLPNAAEPIWFQHDASPQQGNPGPVFFHFYLLRDTMAADDIKWEHGECNGKAVQGGWQICSAISSFDILFLFFIYKRLWRQLEGSSLVLSVHISPQPPWLVSLSFPLSFCLLPSLLFYSLFFFHQFQNWLCDLQCMQRLSVIC